MPLQQKHCSFLGSVPMCRAAEILLLLFWPWLLCWGSTSGEIKNNLSNKESKIPQYSSNDWQHFDVRFRNAMKRKSVMGMSDASQWFSQYNLLNQGDGLKDQNGTHAFADNLAQCKSQLYGYIIKSIPNDARGKLLVGQLDRLHGNDGPAAYRYLEKKSTVGGNATRIQNTRREINALKAQKAPNHCSLAV
eukprot:2027174-Pleurochrysis_carterae.AAC.3